MDFSDAVKTTTREAIIPTVFDSVLKGNIGLLRTLGNAKPWQSGFRLDVIVKFAKSTQSKIVGVGGTYNTSRDNTRVKMQFEPQRVSIPIVLDDIETTLNEGDRQIVSLLATEFDSVAQDLTDELGSYFYTGTGASGSSFDSILNAADDATGFATYGTLARSTYTTLKGDYTGSVGALALSDLATSHSNISFSGSEPTIGLTTKTLWNAYETLLQPTVRAGYATSGFPQVTRTGVIAGRAALGGEIGFSSLYFRGMPLVADDKCTSGKIFLINENFFGFRGINLKGYETANIKGDVEGPQDVPVPRGFNWSGMMRPTDMPAEVGHISYVGNFIATDPRRQSQLTAVTA